MALARLDEEDAVVSLGELATSSRIDKRARKFYERALAAEREGDSAQALDWMKESAVLAPDFIQAHAALAVAYLNAGQLQEAERQVNLSLSLNPDYVAGQEILGLILCSKGQYRDAANILAKVVKQLPCRKTAHYFLSMALGRLDRTKEATDQREMAEVLASNGGCNLVAPTPEPRAAVVLFKDWVQERLRRHRTQSVSGSTASDFIPSKSQAATTR
jgi:tetratricopeptide (TPR) repeat protein